MRFLFFFLIFLNPFPAQSAERLPDGGIAEGMGLRAWYESPTDRYPHGVLGDWIEAGSLAIEQDGEIFRFTLPEDSVFEDLTPRIVDVDGNGIPEVLTIKSYIHSGATVTLYGLKDGKICHLAEAPEIGSPNRWLNPAGVADFDGDGQNEIAVVQTPHIGGKLILYRWDGITDQITEIRRTSGYSTHAIGSRNLGLAYATDWNGDGITDLLLPGQNRRDLVALSMSSGGFKELNIYKMHQEMTGNLKMVGNRLKIPLQDGTVWTFNRPNTLSPAENQKGME